MLAAEFAVLFQFDSVRIILLVFLCVVVSLLAFAADKSNSDPRVISHLAAPPYLICILIDRLLCTSL